MKRIKSHKRGFNKTAALRICLVLILGAAWAFQSSGARADGSGVEQCKICDKFKIEHVDVADVDPVFRFQARISQAKLPVGDVTFPKVIVNFKEGNNKVCTETLEGLKVIDSVLNIDIGRTGTCDLQTLAATKNLKLQVCLKDENNCLQAIKIGTVPYAVRSQYARYAEESDRAREAATCHYAYRIPAEYNLYDAPSWGKGFFSFQTPSNDNIDALVDEYYEPVSEFYDDGFIQWTPIDGNNLPVVHICSRSDEQGGAVDPLEKLFLHAKESEFLGRVLIQGDGKSESTAPDFIVNGDSAMNGTSEFNGETNANGAFTAHSDFKSTGTSVFGDGVPGPGEEGKVHFYNDVVFHKEPEMELEVTGENIGKDVITSYHIDDGTVEGRDIGTNTITGENIGKDAITSYHIDNGSITGSDIAKGTISGKQTWSNGRWETTGNIAQRSIHWLSLDSSACNHNTMHNKCGSDDSATDQGRCIQEDNIMENTIAGNKIRNRTIDTVDLNFNAVTSSIVEDGTIQSEDIKDGTIKSDDLSDEAVTRQKLNLRAAWVRKTGYYNINNNNGTYYNYTTGGSYNICILSEITENYNDSYLCYAGRTSCKITPVTLSTGPKKWKLSYRCATCTIMCF